MKSYRVGLQSALNHHVLPSRNVILEAAISIRLFMIFYHIIFMEHAIFDTYKIIRDKYVDYEANMTILQLPL